MRSSVKGSGNVAATADGTEQHTDAPASPPPPGRRRPGPVATVVGFFGELLITVGLVLGLFVVFPWAEPFLPFNDVTVDG